MEFGLVLDGEHNGVVSKELYIKPGYLAIKIVSPVKRIIVEGVKAVQAVAGVEEEFIMEYPCNLSALIYANQETEEPIGGKGFFLPGAVATPEEVETIGKIMQDIASRTEKLSGAVKL